MLVVSTSTREVLKVQKDYTDYIGLGMYREKKKIEFPEEYYI
jgi:hypothetical protein